MCGIIYVRSKDGQRAVNKEVLKQYSRQKLRGIKGFGLYDAQRQNIVKETNEKPILKWIRNHPSTELLFHHRQPTSTDNTVKGAHPFSTKKFFGNVEYILVHNGIIHNYHELHDAHIERGIEYWSVHEDNSYNDSEALLWDMALWMNGDIPAPLSEGSVALIMYEKHNDNPKLNRLHYYHNYSSPLYMRENGKFFFLQSESGVGLGATEVPINVIHTFDYATRSTIKTPLTIQSFRSYAPQVVESHKPYVSEDESNEVEVLKDAQKKMYFNEEKMARDIKEKVDDAFEEGEGYYWAALEFLKEEMLRLDKLPFSVLSWYHTEVVKGARAVILADPFWDAKDIEAKAPEFEDLSERDEEAHSLALSEAIDETIRSSENSKKTNETVSIFEGTSSGAPVGNTDPSTSLVRDIIRGRSDQIKEHILARRQVSATPELVRHIPIIGE